MYSSSSSSGGSKLQGAPIKNNIYEKFIIAVVITEVLII